MSNLFVWTVRGYQRLISRLTPPSCRFQPTCSHYAIEAVQLHGFLRGAGYSMRRILRCHPFGSFGLDPVPPRQYSEHSNK